MTRELAATVIVCTRNRSHYLTDCLESLSRQDCPEEFEVVVVDNGSTDQTPQLIRDWCQKHSNFRAIHETRIGLSAAKNAGAQSAKGRLLLFTDDDVVVAPEWVSSYLDLFRRIGEHNVMAGGPIVPVLDDLRPWPEWFDTAALPEAGLLDYQGERTLRSWETVWGANMAIPKAVFQNIGGWNEELGRKAEHRGTYEDTEYQDRIRDAGGTVWFCPGSVLKHRVEFDRIRPHRVMSQAFGRGRNEFLRNLLRSRGSFKNPPRETDLGSLLGTLALNLAGWVGWTLAFDVLQTQTTFRRLHRAAFLSGNILERTRGGRERGQLAQWVVRTTFLIRRVALFLTRTPDD